MPNRHRHCKHFFELISIIRKKDKEVEQKDRKIRGLLRNGKGMKMFGNIMTAVMTWKLRRLNPIKEVKKYI